MQSLLIAYIAGLVTILSPCVLPLIPIVLASAVGAHRHGAKILAIGIVISFTTVGLLVSTIGFSVGLTPRVLTNITAAMLILFGVVLLSGSLQQTVALAAAGATSSINQRVAQFSPQGLAGQFLLGLLLGAVWTPCVGPTLGAAIALAAQGRDLLYAGTVMFMFALGAVTPLIVLMTGTREAIVHRKSRLQSIGARMKPLLGGLLIVSGLLILTGLMTQWEAWVLERAPKELIQFIYTF